MESSGKSGNLWMERSSTGTLADVWIFSKIIMVIVSSGTVKKEKSRNCFNIY